VERRESVAEFFALISVVGISYSGGKLSSFTQSSFAVEPQARATQTLIGLSTVSEVKMRLAVVSTHPIQYHSHWYRALAAHPALDIHVYYCHRATPREQANAGFGVEFDWDVPLLTGYPYTFLKNVSQAPGRGFGGWDTPDIKEIIQSRKYDAVMVNGWNYKSAWQAIWACWRSNVKVMVRSDSHLHTRRRLVTRMAKSIVYPRFIRRFDACLAVGTWSRDYFLRYGARPDRIFIVPHTIDNDAFKRQAENLLPSRSDLRKKWGLDPTAIVFAFVGKFVLKKRPMDFVRALEQAARHSSSIQGLMVGDGALRADCETFVQTQGVPVRFGGFLNQSQIAAAYAVCDVLVVPSDGDETWGLVVNESMACGRPCIVSDAVGCGPDLIVPGHTGGTFPMGDICALATTMVDMARVPDRLSEMGAEANRKIQEYSVPTAVERTVNCLATILNRDALHANSD
jgi:glycosyltransferase involved in cell wall biosynthesis